MTADLPDDTLAALRERLARTQEAVDRLTAETAKARSATNGTTPHHAPTGEAAAEAQALASLLLTARNLIPDDLWEQLAEVIRQLLLILRSLVDWWIARLGPGPDGDLPTAQDIPVV